MKHYLKYILRGFKGNLSRFIAVVAIVALGVGFLVGLLSASGDLHSTIDDMYDRQQMMDLNIKSTIGFHKDTINRLQQENVIVEGVYQSEQRIVLNHQNLNSRKIVSDLQHQQINQLTLKNGRFPVNSNECVVLEDNGIYPRVSLNSVIETEETSYTVVGVVQSPLYFAKEKEFNLTGTGRLDILFFLDAQYEESEMITDLFIFYKDLKKYNSFSDVYFEKLKENKKSIEDISETELNRQMASLKENISVNIEKEIKNQLGMDVPFEDLPDQIKQMIEEKTEEEYQKIIEKNGTEWHILDKKSNLSYVGYSQNVDKINKIAVVFPVFFYFIAALVSLTTITRLVEEERGSIGLLKSLGYSKMKIASKYSLYGLVCSILGSIIGVVLGIFVLPYVIYVAFNTLYVLPKCSFEFNVLIILISTLVMIITILFVALYVSLKSLRERPCALLLPKAPKPGKRILLERIPFLWKKTKFKYKNTLRNIFRYKKNLIMMMIGVGGCVTLLLCAFGIQNSIASLGTNQYENILLYDLKVSVEEDKKIPMEEFEEIDASCLARYEEVYLSEDEEYSIQMVTASSLKGFIHLENKKGKPIELKENDVIISEQLAKKFKMKKGSIFKLEGKEKEYKVTEICKNYIQNYIYVYDDDFVENTYLLRLKTLEKEAELVEELSNLSSVSGIEVKSQIRVSYDTMSESMTLIVLVIILCSGALAIIVIYNLTNININERIKEIATLKVLGYQRSEVCGYIYREIFVLCIFGILTGFVFGPVLFKFIIFNIQSPGLWFVDTLHPLYYLYSFLITMVFIFIVDGLFIPKIKSIQMVESLKCVD